MKTILLAAAILATTGCSQIDALMGMPVIDVPSFIHEDGTPWSPHEIEIYARGLNLIMLPQIYCGSNGYCVFY